MPDAEVALTVAIVPQLLVAAPQPLERTFELTFFLDKNSDNRAGLGEGVPGMRVYFLNPRGELLAFLTTNEYGTVTWATAQRVKTILAPAYNGWNRLVDAGEDVSLHVELPVPVLPAILP